MRLAASTWTAALAALLVSDSVDASLHGQVIHTQYGDVLGYPAFNSSPAGNLTQWKEITVWKGIPFAASTGGDNRWKAPQPASAWDGTLNAKSFGPVCPSATNGNNGYTINEDCLNLNVWSAAKSSNASLPVVMWSYPAGSTARDALFDGGGMADQNVVFVNYNYRTGVLGWMAHPELSGEVFAETGRNSSGNWGMLDQFAALKWIRENIQNFGGDPERITVMGQSAGSAATYHILNSPLTKGLIAGAIIQSGVRDPHDPLCASLAEGYVTLNVSLAQGVNYLNSLNVSTIAAARQLPLSIFPSSAPGRGPSGGSSSTQFNWAATLDHYAVPSTYLDTLFRGAANQVPVLTGNTKDESGAEYGLNITLATYLSNLNTTYTAPWTQRFRNMYPANDSASASAAQNAQFADRSKVGTWLWSQLWKKASENPVYNYFWDHAPPGQTRGAYHESEINYVLNNLYATDMPWTAEDYRIARVMNAYWANFVRMGDPNGHGQGAGGLARWRPATVGKSAVVQRVGDGFESVAAAGADKVELFEQWFASLAAF